MKNLSVAKKLSVSFTTIVLLFSILLASVVALGMRSISNSFEGFYEGPYQTVYVAENLSKSLYALEEDMLKMITTDNPIQANEYKAAINDWSEDILGAVALLQEISTLQETQDALNKLVEAAVAGEEINAKMLALHDSGQKEAVKQLFFAEYIDAAEVSRVISLDIVNSCKAVADQYYDSAKRAESQAYVIIAVSCMIILGSTIALSVYVIRSLTRPIKEIEGAMIELSGGQLSAQLSYQSKDELGTLADSVRTHIGTLKGYVHNISYVTELISKGELDISVDLEYEKDFAPIKTSFEQIITSLNNSLSQISLASQQVVSGSAQTSDGAQALAAGATEQAATIEQLNASITSVAQQAEQNSQSVRRAKDYVEQAAQGLGAGNTHMAQLNVAMHEIGESSQQISRITKLVEDIAFQTNILALNAAVEAARAGSAGKGFAVVAEEVRNLAAKSAEAAKQTADLIQKSEASVMQGERLAAETLKILQDVETKALVVSKSVTEVEVGSEQQTSAIDQINEGLSQVSSVVQNNAATAEEGFAASEQLVMQAQALQNEVGKFKLQDASKGFAE